MAKYNLFIDGTEVPNAGRAKKDAVIKIGEATGKPFSVRTDKGSEVYATTAEPTIADDLAALEEQAAQEAETGPETTEEDLIGDSPTEPTPEPEILFYEQIDFPGNYSIVTAPGAVLVAEAAGVPTKVVNVKGRLNRVVHFGGDDMDKAKAVRDLVETTLSEAHSVLKEWQKNNVGSRKGLTDMQKFIQHREVLAKHFAAVAKRVKKQGLS